jgi:hypothetical protein
VIFERFILPQPPSFFGCSAEAVVALSVVSVAVVGVSEVSEFSEFEAATLPSLGKAKAKLYIIFRLVKA